MPWELIYQPNISSSRVAKWLAPYTSRVRVRLLPQGFFFTRLLPQSKDIHVRLPGIPNLPGVCEWPSGIELTTQPLKKQQGGKYLSPDVQDGMSTDQNTSHPCPVWYTVCPALFKIRSGLLEPCPASPKPCPTSSHPGTAQAQPSLAGPSVKEYCIFHHLASYIIPAAQPSFESTMLTPTASFPGHYSCIASWLWEHHAGTPGRIWGCHTCSVPQIWRFCVGAIKGLQGWYVDTVSWLWGGHTGTKLFPKEHKVTSQLLALCLCQAPVPALCSHLVLALLCSVWFTVWILVDVLYLSIYFWFVMVSFLFCY